jgi:hypothetical protein
MFKILSTSFNFKVSSGALSNATSNTPMYLASLTIDKISCKATKIS